MVTKQNQQLVMHRFSQLFSLYLVVQQNHLLVRVDVALLLNLLLALPLLVVMVWS
jgi:hypothetical protein